jgi:hypothetical protein
MGERPQVRYVAVSNREEFHDPNLYRESSWGGDIREEEEDRRYKFELHEDVPWKSIFLGLFLLTMGSVFLVISHFIFIQHMGGDPSQGYKFLVLGILLVMPGKFPDCQLALPVITTRHSPVPFPILSDLFFSY